MRWTQRLLMAWHLLKDRHFPTYTDTGYVCTCGIVWPFEVDDE